MLTRRPQPAPAALTVPVEQVAAGDLLYGNPDLPVLYTRVYRDDQDRPTGALVVTRTGETHEFDAAETVPVHRPA